MSDTVRPPAPNSAEPIALDPRTRRVLELKRQIREGTYRPDPNAIARAILAHWFAVGLELEKEQSGPSVETTRERREAAGRFVVSRSEPEFAADSNSASA